MHTKYQKLRTSAYGDDAMIAVATDADIGGRIAEWLRETFPRNGAKIVANEFDVSPHTTKRWFLGVRPANEHFDAMAARWGWRFLSFVYQGVLPEPPSSDDLGAELQELKGLLARLEGRIQGNGNGGSVVQ